MGKGKRLAENDILTVYSTKLKPATRDMLSAHARAMGRVISQRELIEEMLQAYITLHPDRAEKAQALIELLTPESAAAHKELVDQLLHNGTPAAAYHEEADGDQVRLISTIMYKGKPTVHLEENGRAACGLAGTVDQDSIQAGTPNQVDCKKCRYCRKKVFA